MGEKEEEKEYLYKFGTQTPVDISISTLVLQAFYPQNTRKKNERKNEENKEITEEYNL